MKTVNRIKIRWLVPLLMALALFRPSTSFAWEYTNDFSWLELIPPGYWLDSWSFEDTNWDSDFGFAPLSYTNVIQVPDWHATTPYYYSGTTGYYHFGFPNEYIVTDPEESRAEISRSRTLSIGQSGPASGHGVIQSAVDLNANFGFNNSFPADHSAQWTWPIQTTLGYYNQVLDSIKP